MLRFLFDPFNPTRVQLYSQLSGNPQTPRRRRRVTLPCVRITRERHHGGMHQAVVELNFFTPHVTATGEEEETETYYWYAITYIRAFFFW